MCKANSISRSTLHFVMRRRAYPSTVHVISSYRAPVFVAPTVRLSFLFAVLALSPRFVVLSPRFIVLSPRSSCYRSVRRMLRKECRYSVAIPGDFRPCCVEHTCLVSQLLSGIAVRFRSSYRGGHARASPSRSIRVRQASHLYKDLA